MGSEDHLINSYDRSVARRTLESHRDNGNLTRGEFENRKLLLAVARDVGDLERIFHDLGEMPEISRPRDAFLQPRVRRVKRLDVIVMTAFLIFVCVAEFVLQAQWTVLLLCAIVFVPMIPRAFVELNREEELHHYESGTKKN